MTGRPLWLLPLLIALLAGCSQTPTNDANSDGPTSFSATATASPPSIRPELSGTLDLKVAGELRQNYNLTGCLNARLLFALDPAHAQSLLPPGFRAADIGALLPFAGLPPPGFDAGRAVGGYDMLACRGNSLNDGPAAFSQVGILVDAPNLGDRSPTGSAEINLYLLALHTDNPAWHALFVGNGFNSETSVQADIVSSLAELPIAGQGTGQVSGLEALADVDYTVTANGRALDIQGRYWHATDSGTFYLDFHLTEEVRVGPIPTCTHAAGTAYAAVTSTTICGQEPRFAAVGTATEIAGTAYWLPGIFPAV